MLEPEHVSSFLPSCTVKETGRRSGSDPRSGMSGTDFWKNVDVLPDMKTAHSLLVREALRRTNGNQTLAARMLGITQPAMSKRVRQMRSAPAGEER